METVVACKAEAFDGEMVSQKHHPQAGCLSLQILESWYHYLRSEVRLDGCPPKGSLKEVVDKN